MGINEDDKKKVTIITANIIMKKLIINKVIRLKFIKELQSRMRIKILY